MAIQQELACECQGAGVAWRTMTEAEFKAVARALRAAVGNLRDLTESLRRYPSQAIFGAPPPPDRR